MNTNLMFSSRDSKWQTDPELLEKLAPAFTWDIDVCAERNNVCDNFITPQMDAFKNDWIGLCWQNPPYTRSISSWLGRAAEQSDLHNSTIVCLVPARTDTAWWQDNIIDASWVTFIRGRLKFGSDEYWVNYWQDEHEKGKLTKAELQSKLSDPVTKNSAPFPSALIVYGRMSSKQKDVLRELGWSKEQ